MRKREREITMLYGISVIRDDVMGRCEPVKYTWKDKAFFIAHFLMRTGANIVLLITPALIGAAIILYL